MGGLLRLLFRPLLRPLVRLTVGLLAIPVFRLVLRRVIRLQELDAELEKDLEQWVRGSLLLLLATANMEQVFFGWVPLDFQGNYAWLLIGARLLLAISVIEAMPDQDLFSIIHPGPPKPFWPKTDRLRGLLGQVRPTCRGLLCQHLNRSSPVLAIMSAIFGGDAEVPGQYVGWLVGWICYFMAIAQYLVIGLVTSRDKALDVLSEFDRQIAIRRRELIEEFEIDRHADPSDTDQKSGEKQETVSPSRRAAARSKPHDEASGGGSVAKEGGGGYQSE